jgi:ATP-dependent DNA helicase RecQ
MYHKTLEKWWGYSSFRGLQRDVIDMVLSGGNSLALMQTGAGKSLCFQVPTMTRDWLCVVVTPTLSLIKNQVDDLKSRGISAIEISSQITPKGKRLAIEDIKIGGVNFVYLSPEMLFNDEIVLLFNDVKVDLLVVDEAHCAKMWNKFRSGYRKLMNGVPFPVGVKLAMTATADKETSNFICDGLGIDKDMILTDSLNREQMTIAFVEKSNRTNPIKKIAELAGRNEGSVVVYTNTTKKAREAAEALIEIGVDCAYYYGTGLKKSEKIAHQEAFLSGEKKVMIATDAFGMGIDKADIRYVINLDMPNSIQSAWQQAGRGGRDGKPFTWAMYYHQSDVESWDFLQSQGKEQHKEDKENLAAMYALATSTDCIKRQVMAYFGEMIPNCGKCHNCKRMK